MTDWFLVGEASAPFLIGGCIIAYAVYSAVRGWRAGKAKALENKDHAE